MLVGWAVGSAATVSVERPLFGDRLAFFARRFPFAAAPLGCHSDRWGYADLAGQLQPASKNQQQETYDLDGSFMETSFLKLSNEIFLYYSFSWSGRYLNTKQTFSINNHILRSMMLILIKFM